MKTSKLLKDNKIYQVTIKFDDLIGIVMLDKDSLIVDAGTPERTINEIDKERVSEFCDKYNIKKVNVFCHVHDKENIYLIQLFREEVLNNEKD